MTRIRQDIETKNTAKSTTQKNLKREDTQARVRRPTKEPQL